MLAAVDGWGCGRCAERMEPSTKRVKSSASGSSGSSGSGGSSSSGAAEAAAEAARALTTCTGPPTAAAVVASGGDVGTLPAAFGEGRSLLTITSLLAVLYRGALGF